MKEAENTDRELWRRTPGYYSSTSIHVTKDGGIGINVGGHVIVQTPEKWFFDARDASLLGDKVVRFPCETCDGTGREPAGAAEVEPCKTCKGTGKRLLVKI